MKDNSTTILLNLIKIGIIAVLVYIIIKVIIGIL